MNRAFPLFTTTLSLGNTKFVTAGASWRSIGATLGMTTGKYYMEFKDLGGTNTAFGISDFTNTTTFTYNTPSFRLNRKTKT